MYAGVQSKNEKGPNLQPNGFRTYEVLKGHNEPELQCTVFTA